MPTGTFVTWCCIVYQQLVYLSWGLPDRAMKFVSAGPVGENMHIKGGAVLDVVEFQVR